VFCCQVCGKHGGLFLCGHWRMLRKYCGIWKLFFLPQSLVCLWAGPREITMNLVGEKPCRCG
jgi:hypothetical protein